MRSRKRRGPVVPCRAFLQGFTAPINFGIKSVRMGSKSHKDERSCRLKVLAKLRSLKRSIFDGESADDGG